jgi:hypothetical protein
MISYYIDDDLILFTSIRDHWLLPTFFIIITTGIVWWTNFNVIGKKIFLLFLILLVDKDYSIMAHSPNATILDTNGTLFYTATSFAYSSLLAAG